MKKVYFAPAVEEVELEIENMILAGSFPETNNDENNSDEIDDL